MSKVVNIRMFDFQSTDFVYQYSRPFVSDSAIKNQLYRVVDSYIRGLRSGKELLLTCHVFDEEDSKSKCVQTLDLF